MFAIVLSNIIAIVNAYIFHKLITFQSKVKSFFAITFEFSRFSLSYLFSFILSVFLLPLSVEIIGINPKIAAAFDLISEILKETSASENQTIIEAMTVK